MFGAVVAEKSNIVNQIEGITMHHSADLQHINNLEGGGGSVRTKNAVLLGRKIATRKLGHITLLLVHKIV